MAEFLSPLQLQAGAGLLQNQGLQVVPELVTAVNDYVSLPLLGNLIATINGSGAFAVSTQTLLQTFAGNISNSCPALADSIVSTTVSVVSSTLSNPGMSGIITLTANAYLGDGDVSKFAQIFNSALGYCESTNIFINSAVNAATYLGGTFTSMDNLVSGSLTEVNLATGAFGDDLYNAGQYINLADIENYGSPVALIQQISQRAGTISPLIGYLSSAGINENIILGLGDPDLIVTDSVQKLMFKALQNITGNELADILQILDVRTPNINTLADLLNPAIMFPNSYGSLTTPTADGLKPIYLTPAPVPAIDWDNISQNDDRAILEDENQGRVIEQPLACEIRQNTRLAPVTSNTGSGATYTPNSTLLNDITTTGGISYERLSSITNPGLALANKALACSLDQITNIGRMTMPQLSAAFSAIETNKNLPSISEQTQAVPQEDLDYYKNTFATGSGDNGTILLTDVLGTAAGTNITDNLNNCVSIINALYTAGELDDLIIIYNDMYGNIGDEGIVLGLISSAQSEINNIISANPDETTNLNTYFSAISEQITKETGFQTKATLDVLEVAANSQLSTQSFVVSMPSYGLQTKVGGSAQYLENIATTDRYGQAIIATLREGRTTAGLDSAGVGTANAVPADPQTIPPQAPLIPSVYSARQAQFLVN